MNIVTRYLFLSNVIEKLPRIRQKYEAKAVFYLIDFNGEKMYIPMKDIEFSIGNLITPQEYLRRLRVHGVKDVIVVDTSKLSEAIYLSEVKPLIMKIIANKPVSTTRPYFKSIFNYWDDTIEYR